MIRNSTLCALLVLTACGSPPSAGLAPFKPVKFNLDFRLLEIKFETRQQQLNKKIEEVSASFLGVAHDPNGPLGEGADGEYDNDPLYRTDAFDCTTYIETVMAQTLAKSSAATLDNPKAPATEADILKTMNAIRYKNGEVGFTKRNHFPDLDWIKNNNRDGWLEEITKYVYPQALVARAEINKAGWYAKFDNKRIKRDDLADDKKTLLVEKLKAETAGIPTEVSELPYIPLTALFTTKADGTVVANQELFDKIPSASIVSIVRPNWDLVAAAGTHMNISHQAFVIKKNGVVLIRQSSTTDKKVSEMPLADYLKKYLTSPTIKGINLQSVSTANFSG